MNGNAPVPQKPIHYIIGFNLLIDRISTMRLMAAVSGALQQGAKSITLCISSGGGMADQAFYAYELLKDCPAEVITHNVGAVHSAAMYIFLAGSKRFAVPHANFLMHKTTLTIPTGASFGQDHVGYHGDSITADDERSIAIVAERTKKSIEDVRPWYLGQQLRSTDFALEHGLIDKVMPVQFPIQSQFFQVAVG